MNLINLQIITPEGIFLDQKTEIITVKTINGYIGLQHGKSDFLSSIVPSKLYVGKKNDSLTKEFFIGNGVVYATKTEIKIITDDITLLANYKNKQIEEKNRLDDLYKKARETEIQTLKDQKELQKLLNQKRG